MTNNTDELHDGYWYNGEDTSPSTAPSLTPFDKIQEAIRRSASRSPKRLTAEEFAAQERARLIATDPVGAALLGLENVANDQAFDAYQCGVRTSQRFTFDGKHL